MMNNSMGVFKKSRERMIHKSCDAGMRPNPMGEALPKVPWISRGGTLNLGRNAAKREGRGVSS